MYPRISCMVFLYVFERIRTDTGGREACLASAHTTCTYLANTISDGQVSGVLLCIRGLFFAQLMRRGIHSARNISFETSQYWQSLV